MKGGPEGEQRSGDAAGGVRPALAAPAAHDDLAAAALVRWMYSRNRSGSGGANFSSASSYFKVLGGFFVRGVTPKPGGARRIAVGRALALTDYPLRAELG